MPTRRRLLAALGLAAAAAAFVWWTWSPDLYTADRLTLYAIDGRDEEKRLTGTGEFLHGYPVLGQVEVTDPGQRERLVRALGEGLAAEGVVPAKCFWPRHVLRVEHTGRVTDYVICFQCQNYEAFVTGARRNQYTQPISRHVQPVFDEPLAAANVPLAPE